MAVLLLADVVEGQLATDQVAKALTAVKALGPAAMRRRPKRQRWLV